MATKNNHAELMTQLADGIAQLTSSQAWQQYLEVQSRFHTYSYGNALLIATQCPEASEVAGFSTWRKMNRFVRKGEKAIWILAPMVRRSEQAPDGQDDRVVFGFKFVPVFDIAQTEGRQLPTVCKRICGEDPGGYFAQLVSMAESIGFGVEDYEFNGATNGECAHSRRRIRVEVRNTPAQRVKTLAHEIAHALLHEHCTSRVLAELEAESAAYVVCCSLGIDSSDYSFGYVATWAGGGDQAVEAIKASCGRIQKTASTILGFLEQRLDEVVDIAVATREVS